jgi:hypothetical protein
MRACHTGHGRQNIEEWSQVAIKLIERRVVRVGWSRRSCSKYDLVPCLQQITKCEIYGVALHESHARGELDLAATVQNGRMTCQRRAVGKSRADEAASDDNDASML